MLKIKLIPALLLSMFLVCGGLVNTVKAASNDFILTNESGRTIVGFYCSVSGSGDWGNNIIGEGGFQNGGSTKVILGAFERYWDFRAVLSDGSVWDWADIDLVLNGSVTVKSNSDLVSSRR